MKPILVPEGKWSEQWAWGGGEGVLFKCSWGKQPLPLNIDKKTLNTNPWNLVWFSLWEELVKNTDSRLCSQTFCFFKCRELPSSLKFCRCYRRFWYKWSKDHTLRWTALTLCKAAQPANLLWGECTFYKDSLLFKYQCYVLGWVVTFK